MISNRCRGANLLNYLKQKILTVIDYTFVNDIDDLWCQWKGILTFNGKIYSDFHYRKKDLKSKSG